MTEPKPPGRRGHKLRGRLPGVKNKTPGTVKEAFQRAFELLGGEAGLARWASERRRVKIGGKITTIQPNLAEFYQLAAKLIPSETTTSGQILHGHYVAREVAVEQRDPLPAIPAAEKPGRALQVVEDAELVEKQSQPIDFIG